jgi:hypothetical protein
VLPDPGHLLPRNGYFQNLERYRDQTRTEIHDEDMRANLVAK